MAFPRKKENFPREVTMKTWPIAVIGLACLIFSGCRTDPAIQLLERDNRRLEDEIYRLRGCLEDYESGTISAGAKAGPAKSSRRKLREEETSAAPSSNQEIPPGAVTTPPKVEMQELPENEVPGIGKRPGSAPPRVNPNKTPGAFNPPKNPRAMPSAEPAGPALGGTAGAEMLPPSVPAENISYVPPPKGDSFNAVQIVLHDKLCTASETDGLRVVFEPRDRNDRRVDAPADVSIVLIDPTLNLPEARVARWDFPADAVASMFRGMNTSKVIYIEAPWPDKPPQNKKLRLFVRYTTRDGRKLQADLPIEITRPADRITRLKPPRRLEPAVEEASGPALAQEEAAARTAAEDASPVESAATPPDSRREPLRTATRESTRLQRPVWSPERR
jgi:hypothetical protein